MPKKLVRDKILDSIKNKNEKIKYRISDDEEYGKLLNRKLSEVAEDLCSKEPSATGSKNGNQEKLADIYEVVEAIIDYKKFDLADILDIKEDLACRKRCFKKRFVLE